MKKATELTESAEKQNETSEPKTSELNTSKPKPDDAKPKSSWKWFVGLYLAGFVALLLLSGLLKWLVGWVFPS